jgi:hypothetical protein
MSAHQDSLFGDELLVDDGKPPTDAPQSKKVLITVKAAPNPSLNHGETVCVAGIRLDEFGNRGWIRLYPINFRHLQSDSKFAKYDVVTVDCRPARQDGRVESWKPVMDTMRKVGSLKGWPKRRPYVDSLIQDNMCALRKASEKDASSQSLALVRPTEITGFTIEPHPGWTVAEQGKIDAYVNQMVLFDSTDKTPLEAPDYRGIYHWRCANPTCNGHNQSIIDWEFVATQRHLRKYGPTEAQAMLRKRWYEEVCAPSREVSFYVGNQAKRPQTFSILGVYWPRFTD